MGAIMAWTGVPVAGSYSPVRGMIVVFVIASDWTMRTAVRAELRELGIDALGMDSGTMLIAPSHRAGFPISLSSKPPPNFWATLKFTFWSSVSPPS